MKLRFVLSVCAVALISSAGLVSAQTSNFVSVTTNAASSTPTAGTSGAVLGTITLSAPQSGQFGNVSLSSLPISLNLGGGATAGNLSGCQVYNQGGTALNTGTNAVGTVSGANTFTFDTPLQIAGGQSTTLQIRCNVASGIPSGASYLFSAGMPMMSAGLLATLNATPSVRVGAQDTLMALITLSGQRSGSAVQVASIPLTASFANGAQVGHISDCRVRNLSNLVNPLNNGGNAVGIVQGSNSIPLDTPLQIPAGSTATLAFTCDVSSTAPVGGQVMIATTPGSIPTTVVGSGTSVTAATGFGLNNQPGSVSGTVAFSNVATTPEPTTPGPTIPGVPNTGFGPTDTTMLLLSTGFIALLGLIVARRLVRV